MAAMLVVDLDDGGGDECAWVGTADSIGLTAAWKRGAHNGWSAPTGADVNDPAYFISAHLGQPGTCYDHYSVRGSRDTLTGNAGNLGGRLAPRCVGCPSAGRESRQGPTSTMLRLYRGVLLLTGDRVVQVLGPAPDAGQNDWGMLQEYMILPGGSLQPRALWVMGSGFAESETAGHASLLSSFLRASLRHADYSLLSGNPSPSVPLTVIPTAKDYGLLPNELDVLNVEVTAPVAQAYAYYENVGTFGPYVASVYKPSYSFSRYISLLDGFALRDLGSVGNTNTYGRWNYVTSVLTNPLGSAFWCFPPPGDVPEAGPARSGLLRLLNNPMVHGAARIELSLPRPDRVKVVVHDIAGRVVRVLDDGAFETGPQELAWDGPDGSGRRVANGVYLVRAITASALRESRTLVLIR